jgi:hypothetical protein
MISTFKTIIPFILASSLAYLFYDFSIFENRELASHVSQFIALKGGDEYVIAELVTTEHLHRESGKHLKFLDIPIQHADLAVSLQVHFKYYIKLSELEYSMTDDTLVFTVPKLYLSTPVAFESSTFKPDCQASLFSNCKKIGSKMMSELSKDLEEKGLSELPVVYEKVAKALADNFDDFVRNNENIVFHRNIAVVFSDEAGPSQRLFSYDKNSILE